MKRALTDKQKMMAYVLNQDPDFGYSQKKIADMMGVSQPTISNSIDDVQHWREIQDLTRQLNDAKRQLADLGVLPEEPVFYLD